MKICSFSMLLLLLVGSRIFAQQPLSVHCPPHQTNGVCGGSFALVTYPPPTASGGCVAKRSVICLPPSGGFFLLGPTTVTCTATNDCHESAVCSFRITVAHDTTPPVLQCPTNLILPVCGPGGAVPVVYPIPTATDNADASVTVACAPPSGSLFPPGLTVVVCTATDDCTNRSDCTFTVTVVRDTTPPSIRCPSNVVAWTCSTNGAVVTFPPPVATDDTDPNPVVACTPPSGSLFPLGLTFVHCTATDACTNRAGCSFGVAVRLDTNAPSLLCPTDRFVLDCDTNGLVVNYPPPIASDLGDPAPTVLCAPPSGSLFPAGVTVVGCSATDHCGNIGQCSFEVRVVPDLTPPTIDCPPDLSMFACSPTGRVVAFLPPAADDNGSISSKTCTPPSLSVFAVGTTAVNCTAVDGCGLEAHCVFRVTVALDVTAPAFTCPGDIVVEACDPRGTVVDWTTPEVTDNNLANPHVTCTPSSGSVFPVGVTPVTCEAKDSCGNRASCTFNVTVRFEVGRSRIDTDHNGLDDIWEIHFHAQDLAPGDDTDGDGLTNAEEMTTGTDPRNGVSTAQINLVGSVRDSLGHPSDYIVSTVTVPGKRYQLQFALTLGGPWHDWGRAHVPTGGGGMFRESVFGNELNSPMLSTNTPQAFFRMKIMDVDEDLDGLTAWEESILGTSDQTPASHGGLSHDVLLGGAGGDRQAALDWISTHLGQSRLREVALAHLGGSPLGPFPAQLVTATGTGGWLKLSSWMLDNGSLEPVHLQDTPRFEGWNAKLEVLKPPQAAGLTWNPFVSGRLRNDENLWLTVRRVDGAGAHTDFGTLGYGANASLRVYDYAMSHLPVVGSGIGVQSFILVTPVMGLNTANQPELRVVTWSIAPNSGAINGLFDTGNLGHTELPEDGGRLQIVREAEGRFVVSYLNRFLQLSSWFFEVGTDGSISARGGATSGLDIRGEPMDPLASTDFALGPLNAAGFSTLLADANCAARFAVWEDRVVSCDAACYANPFFITDNTHDLNPYRGVVIAPPLLTDAWDDTSASHDGFGRALAAADFNGDGRADAAIGIPSQDVAKAGAPSAESAGAFRVMYGGTNGLGGTYADRFWSQDSAGLKGLAETGDRFSEALAAGDFNGDGFADLAVGAPGELVEGIEDAGAVNVLYGSAAGLSAAGDQLWYQGADGLGGTPGHGDAFGCALVAGDFNGDGFADLAIGVHYETIEGVAEAGAVQILYGAASGLSATAGPGTQFLHQGSPSMIGAAEEDDHFGTSLAAGDLNGDGRDDLVVGIPNEEVNGMLNAGAVQIIYGSASGLGPENQLVYQGNIEPANDAFPALSEVGDSFGREVAVGDFNDDGFTDLAVGAPQEDLEDLVLGDAGVVHILRGSAAGVIAADHQLLVQTIPDHGDVKGSALAVGDFNGDGRTDLAVSSPNEALDVNTVPNAGLVEVYHGGTNGLSLASLFYQGAVTGGGYEESGEEFDGFGFALAAGDFNGDGRTDLLVGVPNEDLSIGDEDRIDAGVVQAIYGSASGLSGAGDKVWLPGEPLRVRALLTDKQREATGLGEGKVFERMPAGERTNVHVASVTKCMTLLLAVELLATPGANVQLDDEIEVSAKAAGTGGSKVAPPYGDVLGTNDVMPFELLLHGMMLRSCNKSSVAIGEHLARKQYEFLHGAVPGGFSAHTYFITNMMQGKADQLAMVNTLCGHAAGGMITTPQDLITLWQHAWQLAEFRRIASATTYSGSGVDAEGDPKDWDLEKHSTDGGYPGLEGWKGGNGGLWDLPEWPFGVPWCAASVVGQATRLDRSLTFALEQTGSRWPDSFSLLDHGYRLLFTPDLRGEGSLNVAEMAGFAVSSIHDRLAVTAVISGTNTLRLDAWQVVAALGQVTSVNHSTRSVTGLPAGTHSPRVRVFDLAPMPVGGESEADYLTGRMDGEQLRFNVWRVAAEPGF